MFTRVEGRGQKSQMRKKVSYFIFYVSSFISRFLKKQEHGKVFKDLQSSKEDA